MAFSELSMPSADEVARAVIATCLMSEEGAQEAAEILTPDDFLEATGNGPFWAGAFQAIKEMVEKGRRPVTALVAQAMKRNRSAPQNADGTFSDVTQTLIDIGRSYTVGAQIGDYARIMQRYGLRRRIRMAGHKLIDLASDERPETEELPGIVEAIVTEATTTREMEQSRLLGEVILERMSKHLDRKPGEFTGIKTGFRDLDVSLRGMQGGDLIILAARPSMGKSALAQDIGTNVARKDKSVLFVSREMPDEQLADRSIAADGGINAGDLRAGLVPKDRLMDAQVKMSDLFEAKIVVDCKSRSVPEIRAKAIRMKRQTGCDLIIVDYLQRLSGTGRYAKSANRVLEIGEISGALKELAREMQIPVIALSQLSRAVESRRDDDKRPQLSDLRESGDIEQDADVVAFLYRQRYYNKESTDNTAEVIIAKNRNGPLGTVELEFIPERVTFIDKALQRR